MPKSIQFKLKPHFAATIISDAQFQKNVKEMRKNKKTRIFIITHSMLIWEK